MNLKVGLLVVVMSTLNGVMGHEHHHEHHHEHEDRYDMKIWGEALFATALVGIAPVIFLFFVPLGSGNIQQQKPMLRVFLSFAAGGLLGDSFLHLLPHSMPQKGHDHHHSDHSDHSDHEHHSHSHSMADLAPWLWTLVGIVSFLMLEKFVRSHTDHHHHHSEPVETEMKQKKTSTSGNLRSRKSSKKESKKEIDHHPIAAAGYLNLAADFSHNFTDGLAIGATFLQGSGWQTTLAMLLHEVPHEIGDFAILIQSGFSRRQAMWSQVWTAVGAMIGTVIGLLMEGAGEKNAAWITPFTAGGFIYIACTSVFPEILQDNSFYQSIKELVAMLSGIALMVGIALYE